MRQPAAARTAASVYPHRSQWPVGQSGKYYNTAPWGLRHGRWPASLSPLNAAFGPQTPVKAITA